MLCLLLAVLSTQSVLAQSLQERADKIRAATDGGNFKAALEELRSLENADATHLALNNYDYLLARLLERTGDRAGSISSYQSVVTRRSLLAQYALWHLAQI